MKRFIAPLLLAALTTTATAQNETTSPTASDTTKVDSAAYWKQLEIGEVSVSAQRQLVKNEIDRLSYDVQHDEESKTKNVLEMLRKVPLVTVDGQENIKVKGQSNFKIYRNGHADPSFSGSNIKEILKSIPASAIKKIEVITDPGAKEDAEGSTYILNIVMMNNSSMKGATGTLSFQMNELGSYNPYAYVTAQSGKLIVSANVGGMHGTKEHMTAMEDFTTTYKETGNTLTQNTKQITPADALYGNLSASYDIDSLNLISLSGNGFGYNVDVNHWGSWELMDANKNLIYKYDTSTKMRNYDYYKLGGRFDFQHKTHLDGEVLTLSYMLASTHYGTDQETTMSNAVNTNFGYDGYFNDNKEDFMEHTFQLDYVRPFAKYHKMEIGVKYINRDNHSVTGQTYLENGVSTDKSSNIDFDHNTQIGAVYGEWMMKKDKWSARAGLRYEYSYLKAEYKTGKGENYSKKLNDWCPSASLQYQISDANTLKFSYSTNINRPGISYLNPAEQETPEHIQKGNAQLSSSRNNSLSMNFMHYGSKFTFGITPEYSWSNNKITEIESVINNQRISTFENVLKYKDINISGYIQAQPFKGNNVNFNAYVGKEVYENPNIGLKYDPLYASFDGNISQHLPWNLVASVGGGFSCGRSAESVYGYGGNWHYYYATIQKSFLKDNRLTVRIYTGENFCGKYDKYISGTVQGDYTSRNIRYNRNERFGFGVTWRFGKLKAQVKQVENSIQNDDMVGGISQGGGKSSGKGGK